MTPINVTEALALIEDLFNMPAGTVTPGAQRSDLMGWDSMGTILLIAELDERFGIALTSDQAQLLTTVGHVLDLLRTHGALRD